MKKLYVKDQVEICEYYQERFNEVELAIMFDISEFQVIAILEKFGVERRTEML